ncbi:MAG: flavodoxin family protein [Clostridiales bacterium]|nr:flavodoxin family protein [Clostridiales bacterium]
MKALLINGSPIEQGSIYVALGYVAEALKEEGVDSEIYQIPREPISGCRACYACKAKGDGRCSIGGDAVNVILEKMEGSDALVLGSPVYYAAPNGQLLAALDRVFFSSGGTVFAGKPAAAVCAARRGGTTATLDVLQKYFTIAGMPTAPTTYWPMIHGRGAEDVVHDAEGIQTMQMLGKTLAWLIKCIAAGKAAGVSYPSVPGGEKVWTDFIR